MAGGGIFYMINGMGVTAPDDEIWSPIIMGDGLTNLQKRSRYNQLTWKKTLVEKCDLDWLQFDNVELASLVCRPPDELVEWELYDLHVICQSVTMKQHHDRGVDVTAVFLVRME